MEFCDIHNLDLINDSRRVCEYTGLDCTGLLFADEKNIKITRALRLKDSFDAVMDMPEIRGIGRLPLDLILMDENGVIIANIDGNTDAPGILCPGVSMLEADAGTSGFSLAAKYKKPFLVNGEEHYLQMFKNCVSYALPMVIGADETGIIGCLVKKDIFLPPMDKLFMSFTGLVGGIIAKCYEKQQLAGELDIIREYLANEQGDVGVIALDKEYRLLCANTLVLKTLGVNHDAVYGKKIDELLGSGCRAVIEAGGGRFNNLKIDTPRGDIYYNIYAKKIIASHGKHTGWILEVSLSHARDLAVTRAPKYDFSYIVGDNTDLMRCVNLAKVVANGNSNVLITGESGTGKEVFTQAIHYASQFKNGPFIAINTSAIPAELMESELFGYSDGAFTGAKRSGMDGKFFQANHGTLFLDEIGDMPLDVQPKLLRVLQDRRITPLGGKKSIDLNIRIISATNQNLQELIKQGKFRSDLYYRLNVVEINIPPLRERAEDIPALVKYFLEKFRSRLNKNVLEINVEAMEVLKAYRWPGNVRELENVIESAVNLTASKTLEVKHLPVQVITEGKKQLAHKNNEERMVGSLLETEKMEIIKALEIYNGNIKRAAQALQIGRTTLYRRIRDFDLIDYIEGARNLRN